MIYSIKIDYHIDSFDSLFPNYRNIEEIKFKKFFRNNMTSMRRMFKDCRELKKLDLSYFNTENITNMKFMFDFNHY